MAAESETDYKEGAFDNDQVDVPVKVHIIAPSTLPEGYEFEAEIGAPGAKKTINVEVVSVVGRLAGLICYIICKDMPCVKYCKHIALLSSCFILIPSLHSLHTHTHIISYHTYHAASRRCRGRTGIPRSTSR